MVLYFLYGIPLHNNQVLCRGGVKETIYNITTPYRLIHSLYALNDRIKYCVLFSLLQHNTSLELGQVIRPTEGDLEKIRKLYNCMCVQKRPEWPYIGLLNGIVTKTLKL